MFQSPPTSIVYWIMLLYYYTITVHQRVNPQVFRAWHPSPLGAAQGRYGHQALRPAIQPSLWKYDIYIWNHLIWMYRYIYSTHGCILVIIYVCTYVIKLFCCIYLAILHVWLTISQTYPRNNGASQCHINHLTGDGFSTVKWWFWGGWFIGVYDMGDIWLLWCVPTVSAEFFYMITWFTWVLLF